MCQCRYELRASNGSCRNYLQNMVFNIGMIYRHGAPGLGLVCYMGFPASRGTFLRV